MNLLGLEWSGLEPCDLKELLERYKSLNGRFFLLVSDYSEGLDYIEDQFLENVHSCISEYQEGQKGSIMRVIHEYESISSDLTKIAPLWLDMVLAYYENLSNTLNESDFNSHYSSNSKKISVLQLAILERYQLELNEKEDRCKRQRVETNYIKLFNVLKNQNFKQKVRDNIENIVISEQIEISKQIRHLQSLI